MKVIEIPARKPEKKKIKVAAYARVSMDKEAAFHSLEAQQKYYNSYIKKHPGWELVEVYSDNGISGTIVERPEFQRMLEDCRKKSHPIDLIITKSITRFARNTMTLLTTIRELKSLDIDVYFEKERMHSISSDGEMMITLLAVFAEEEARSASENMKWRIRKRFEQGQPWKGRVLGYELQNCNLVVVPKEAEIVREIFRLFLSGMGRRRIAKEMAKKYPAIGTINSWSENGIDAIIRNEKYKGDLLLQKTYRPNYRDKKDKPVNGNQVRQYYVKGGHEAIIPPETFDAVQKEIRRRKDGAMQARKKQPSEWEVVKRPLCRIVQCRECGFNCRYKMSRGNGYPREVIVCNKHQERGNSACTMKAIPYKIIQGITAEVLRMEPAELTQENVRKVLKKIILDKDKLIYHFKDGRVIEKPWQLISRSKSWTPEMREKARLRALAQTAKRKAEKSPQVALQAQ